MLLSRSRNGLSGLSITLFSFDYKRDSRAESGFEPLDGIRWIASRNAGVARRSTFASTDSPSLWELLSTHGGGRSDHDGCERGERRFLLVDFLLLRVRKDRILDAGIRSADSPGNRFGLVCYPTMGFYRHGRARDDRQSRFFPVDGCGVLTGD